MQIRAAHGGDDDAIWEILRPVIRAGDTYALPPDMERDAALAYWGAHRVYVADEDGALLGTYYLRPNQRGGGDHVCNCGYMTAAASRGRGVARALLDHSLAEARGQGFRAMQFNFVVETNNRAIEIWRRAGFAVVGRLPAAFRHPSAGVVDALVMYRHLV